MQIAIVGLPNVGKSTLFNALVKGSVAEAANYPFCTIDPNVGVVEVTDKRITEIEKIVVPKKTLPAVTEFVDIAGLVKGASGGEGLGNQFLSHIRECDAIAQVVRVFEDNDITHVHDKIDPKNDKEIIEMELMLADLQTVQKRFDSVSKKSRTGDKDSIVQSDFYQKVKTHLENGDRAYTIDVNEEELPLYNELHLLTSKPILYIANLDENQLTNFIEKEYKEKLGLDENDQIVPICAKLEEDLSELSSEEAEEILKELDIPSSGKAELIMSAYNTLGLETYFTAGEQEVRAWTFKRGMTAPQCAGIIHTDFEKGFICSDVVSSKDFIDSNGWKGAKDKGVVKMQGRDYIMQDGDVCFFKFNV